MKQHLSYCIKIICNNIFPLWKVTQERVVVLSQPTVTSMQWRSLCSSWFLLASTEPNSCWSRWTPDTRRMVRPLSQQKDCSRVKWICSATSSASSAARTHSTTLSGSLGRKEKMMDFRHLHSHARDRGYFLKCKRSIYLCVLNSIGIVKPSLIVSTHALRSLADS